MKNLNQTQPSRRQFLIKTVPACALTCIAHDGAFSMSREEFAQDAQQSKHKFDAEMDLTRRQFWADRGRQAINLFKSFDEAFGKEKVIEILKGHTYKRAKGNGERFRKRKKTNDFETFKTRFVGPGSYSETLIVADVVENSKTALEIKVTECVIAEAYVKAYMGEYGYAYNCWGDHCWQDGYNTKIKLIRDKTLMQGHDYCNHRYVWTG